VYGDEEAVYVDDVVVHDTERLGMGDDEVCMLCMVPMMLVL
jgi:hypothetical protein